MSRVVRPIAAHVGSVAALCAAALLVPAAVAAQAPVFAPVAEAGCVGQTQPGVSQSSLPQGCRPGAQLLGARAIAVDDRAVFVASGTGGVAMLAPQPGGGLAFSSCISDDASTGAPGGYGGCADGDALGPVFPQFAGLAADLALGPEGRGVYVAAAAGVAWLTRRPDGLAALGCAKDANRGDRCAGTGMLGRPSAIAVSPDGGNVYVADADRDAVVTFIRDPATGALTAAGCISESGSDGLCAKAVGLIHPTGLAVAPDGSAVYAVGTIESYDNVGDFRSALAVLARDPADGHLRAGPCVVDGVGAASCASAETLGGAGDLALSPDGRFLYTVSGQTEEVSPMLSVFSVAGGRLAPVSCAADPYEGDEFGCVRVSGFGTPYAVAVSPAGTLVAVATDGGLFGFAPNPATGVLAQSWCATGENEACGSFSGDGFDGVAFSSDGSRLYATSSERGAVIAFGPAPAARSATVAAGARTARLRLACPRGPGPCRGTVRVSTSRSRFVIPRGRQRDVTVRLPAAVRARLQRSHRTFSDVRLESRRRLLTTQRVALRLPAS